MCQTYSRRVFSGRLSTLFFPKTPNTAITLLVVRRFSLLGAPSLHATIASTVGSLSRNRMRSLAQCRFSLFILVCCARLLLRQFPWDTLRSMHGLYGAPTLGASRHNFSSHRIFFVMAPVPYVGFSWPRSPVSWASRAILLLFSAN